MNRVILPLLFINILLLGLNVASTEKFKETPVLTDYPISSSLQRQLLRAHHDHKSEEPVYTLRIHKKPTTTSTTSSSPTKSTSILKSLLPPLCFHITSTSRCWKNTQTQTFTISHSTVIKTSTKTKIIPTCTTTTFVAAYHKTITAAKTTATTIGSGDHISSSIYEDHYTDKHQTKPVHSGHQQNTNRYSNSNYHRHYDHKHHHKSAHDREKHLKKEKPTSTKKSIAHHSTASSKGKKFRPTHKAHQQHLRASSIISEQTYRYPAPTRLASTTTSTTNMVAYGVTPAALSSPTISSEPTMASANNLNNENDENNNGSNENDNGLITASSSTNDNDNSDVSDTNEITTTNPETTTSLTDEAAASSPSNTPTDVINSFPNVDSNDDNNTVKNDPNSPGENDVNHRALGIGLGVGIGCVAALGLAGMLVYNNRRRRLQQQSLGDYQQQQQVSTRWRPQSFMNVVASVVAKLPRSPSLRSKASTTNTIMSPNNNSNSEMTGIAVTTTDTTSLPALVSVEDYYYGH
ncbi:hypothetical protein BDF20DRAFT_890940 [Mycotypha africana]|uniref:uncharacterized protein n=1 Tax=Mycotypha africana TaxID=64632 RepID=UPI002300B647|nr:uncharacterized protein BDF20DRAFT_890940 [Mycotypha africana]KAI8970379.1 hypothetical protein BDF20DRAFT_890940 [Mycotypha africana]